MGTHRRYERWTDAQIALLKRMLKEGKPCALIAEATGHPLGSVWAKSSQIRRQMKLEALAKSADVQATR